MSDILGTIFGSKSKEKSSSSSSSNSVTGNNAYDTINNSLAPTLGFSGAGGSMIGALLGIPGYASQSPTQAVSTAQSPSNGYSGVPQVYTPPASTNPAINGGGMGVPSVSMGGGVDGSSPIFHDAFNKRDLGRTDLGIPSSAGDNPYHYSYLPGVDSSSVDALSGGGYAGNGGGGGSVPPSQPGGGGGYVTPSASGASDALNNFANSAGINFLRDQGTKAIEASQAGKGMLQSGATGKALTDYGQNLGSTFLNNYLTHLTDFSKLGTANAAVLSDAGRYSNALMNSTSSGSGTGGKTGLLQSLLGGSGGGSLVSALA